MSVKNHSDLNSEITSEITTNGSQLITGSILQGKLLDLADSSINILGDTVLGKLAYSSLLSIVNDGDIVYKKWVIDQMASAITWGAITGTLTDQTDLQSALNLKADDSAVVHKTGTETIAGAKTFSSAVTVNTNSGFNQAILSGDSLSVQNGLTSRKMTMKAVDATDPSYVFSEGPGFSTKLNFPNSGSNTNVVTIQDKTYTVAGTDDVATALSTAQSYADALAAGLKWKQSVKAATTANITLSGAQTIDGISAIAGDRVLVKNQSTGSQNGIYVVASGAWTRSADADSATELTAASVMVEQGTVNADFQFTQTADNITVGSTSLTWVQLSTGSVTSVSGTTNRITSTGGSTPVLDISATFESLLGKVANPLSQFASTTSAQLRGVLSDELGTGAALFDGATPTSFVLTNATGLPISTGVSGLGTGVATTLATNLSITGGGTISLGGFTLTVPATGTAALGTGGTNRIAYWSGTNNLTSNSNLTYDGVTVQSTVSANSTSSFTNINGDVNTGASSFVIGSNGTALAGVGMYGTGFGTNGLLVANLGTIRNTSAVGILYANANASTSTYHRWSIGGTATGNQIMNLLNTGLSLTPNTLTDGSNALSVTATMPTTITTANNAISYNITSAGSSAFNPRAMLLAFNAGYTGSASTIGLAVNTTVAGTATQLYADGGNFGLNVTSTGTTGGYNIGGRYAASGGNLNAGVYGRAVTLKNGATNIGGFFCGNNTGTSPIHIGVYAGLNPLSASDPTFVSAALIADNASTTDPIALFRDNGTVVWTFADGGALTAAEGSNIITGTTTGTKIGTATGQKLGFWNAAPIVQPTTGVAAATLVSNAGTALTSTDTFDGYTLQQIVKALRNSGLLA